MIIQNQSEQFEVFYNSVLQVVKKGFQTVDDLAAHIIVAKGKKRGYKVNMVSQAIINEAKAKIKAEEKALEEKVANIYNAQPSDIKTEDIMPEEKLATSEEMQAEVNRLEALKALEVKVKNKKA